MKIAVNTRLLLPHQLEGIGRYTYELFTRLSEQHPEHAFHFIFDRKVDPRFSFADNVQIHVVHPQVRHPFLAVVWFDFQLRKKLRKIKPDLFISPDGMNSLRPVCKNITVLHDINFVHFPQYFPFFLRAYYQRRTPLIARRSDRIVTVSNFSARDIAETYQINPQHIQVIYNSVGTTFVPLEKSIKAQVRNKITQGKPYFVFVGGMYHRKNLLKQFEAFEIFKKETGSEVNMVYVGQVVKDASELLGRIKASAYVNSVHVLGRQSEKDMKEILGSALALTYVSTIEGFGIPLLEAMCSEVPILTGNVSSMPEICGEAAVYADPNSSTDIAEQMKQLAEDAALRDQLIENARIRAQDFSWDQSAEQFWTLIQEVLKQA